ncbi:uncharacterized protein BX663DRAFT_496502 [Cokeromyces recurvatus]|uniref:uncharacterized protein n=1 Tax=Cokeromyces recurvatus TaxID=90255 RepID=UPI00221FF62B|nr:uncharacterized protein BX663DRAFT_496502 [Cokeromyces recurvatus]KAI7906462.1 hypothetical protein BX663DRAFT_496502 [Cokeromyces recurvatus]
MINSLPKEILFKIFDYLSEEEMRANKSAFKLVNKSWCNAIKAIYGHTISVRVREEKLPDLYRDLLLCSHLAEKIEHLQVMEFWKEVDLILPHIELQHILLLCPNLSELSIDILDGLPAYLEAIRQITYYLNHIQKFYICNLQACSRSRNMFYFHICLELRNSLTYFEISNGTTYRVLEDHYGGISNFLQQFPNLHHLKIKLSPYMKMNRWSINLASLFDSCKALRNTEFVLAGFLSQNLVVPVKELKKINCEPTYNSLKHLQIQLSTIHGQTLRYIMTKFKGLKMLSLDISCGVIFSKPSEKTREAIETFFNQFNEFIEMIDSVHVYFKCYGQRVSYIFILNSCILTIVRFLLYKVHKR